jgi:molybdopterin converting factor small subunit
VSVIVLSLAGSGYYQYVNTVDEEVLREGIAADMNLKFELDKINSSLDALLLSNLLTDAWDGKIQALLTQYTALEPLDNEMAVRVHSSVAAAYLAEANQLIDRGSLTTAELYIAKAESWGGTAADAIRSELDDLQAEEVQRIAEQQQLAQQKMLAAELVRQQQKEEARVARVRDQKDKQKKAAALEKSNTIIAASLSLECNGIDIKNNASAKVKKLKASYPAAYRKEERGLLDKVAACVKARQVAKPADAELIKQQAVALFPEAAALASLTIDYCLRLRPGSGGRSNRNICKDRIASALYSPLMVSVGSADRRYAISKYEVSEKEYSVFCRDTGCAKLGGGSKPVTNISVADVNDYLAWLSRKTGFSYRLPNYEDWLFAATAANSKVDADRNCYLKYAGIEKGNVLIDTTTGKKNRYGLVNAVGNVQELVLEGDSLFAAGGNRQDPMSQCLVTTRRAHTGKPDQLTGFRFVRAIGGSRL